MTLLKCLCLQVLRGLRAQEQPSDEVAVCAIVRDQQEASTILQIFHQLNPCCTVPVHVAA